MKHLEKVEDIQNFWKWWSVQMATLSASLSAAAAAYGAIALTAPALVEDIPKWVGLFITLGAMGSAIASAWLRGVVQPKLKEEE